jgi:hypothetical protein
MLDVKHRMQDIRELRRLLKIFDMLEIKRRGHGIKELRRTTI